MMRYVFEHPVDPPAYAVGRIKHMDYESVQSYLDSINAGDGEIEQCPPTKLPIELTQDPHIVGFHANGNLYRHRLRVEAEWSYVVLYEGCLIID